MCLTPYATAAAITGQLTNADTGAVIAGAAVDLLNPADESVVATVNTDGLGTYTFSPAAATYHIRTQPTGYFPSMRFSYSYDAVQSINLNFALQESGEVYRDDFSGVAGWTSAANPSGGTFTSNGNILDYFSDFTVGEALPNSYDWERKTGLSITPAGRYVTLRRKVDISVGSPTQGWLWFFNTWEWSGVLSLPTNTPWREDSYTLGSRTNNATLTAFDLINDPADNTASVWHSYADYVLIHTRDRGYVSGTVRNLLGGAVPGARVEVLYGSAVVAEAQTDGAGAYSVMVATTGATQYSVRAGATGYEQSTAGGVAVTGRATTTQDMTLSPTLTATWFAGSGKDGPLFLNSPTRVENSTRTAVTGTVTAGATIIPVANTGGFSAGDLVMLIQMFGTGAGKYEFARVESLGVGLKLTRGVRYPYQAAGAQVLRVQEYSQVTMVAGAVWTAPAWNGTTGGVFAAVVRGSVTVTGGSLSVNGLGFSGGAKGPAGQVGFQGFGFMGGGIQATGANGNGGGGGGSAANGSGGGGGGNTSGAAAGGGSIPGQPGGPAGLAGLSTMLPGGGGGGGGGSSGQAGAAGSAGGGIIFLAAAGDVKVTAGGLSASAFSGVGAGGTSGSGGGGAGGSIRIVSTSTVDLGSSVLSALGGGGGTGGGASGGVGASGRIAVLSVSTPTGTTTPAFDASSSDGITLDDPYTAPGAVTDLRVSAVIGGGLDIASMTVRLTWSAPGADASSTTIQNGAFTVRYSPSPILSDLAFAAAPFTVDIATTGVVPGSTQTIHIGPLDPTVTWYFALKTTDTWAMISALSNPATAQARQSVIAGSGGRSYGISWGDYDRDGIQDLGVGNGETDGGGGANLGERFVKVYPDGRTTFIPYSAGDTTDLAFGDLDHDGVPELVIANGFGPPGAANGFYRAGGGDVTFTGSNDKSLGVALADFDNDGDLDIFYANDGSASEVVFNEGGAWTRVPIPGTAGLRSIGAAAADFDGDGRMDVAVAVESGGSAYVVFNEGGRNFSTANLAGATGFGRGVAAADLNGDGRTDIALAYTAGGDEMVVRNDGGRSFGTAALIGSTGGNSERIAAADYDNDGDIDLVVTNLDVPNRLLRNDGNFSFTVSDLPKTPRSRGVAWADYDDDGDADLAVANDGSSGGSDAADEFLIRNDTGTANAAPVPPGPDDIAVMFAYAPAGSTLTFAWKGGAYDGATATAALNFDIAVSTYSLDLHSDPRHFVATLRSFVVPPADRVPGFGFHQRPGFKDWTGEGFPFHAVQLSTKGAYVNSPLQWNTTYYLRVATIDPGLSRSSWSAQKAFYLPDPCATNYSLASGNWSNRDTWATGVLPYACTPVVIEPGHEVTVDITTATVSTTTVYGRLSFDRVLNSTLTMVGGGLDIRGGGVLDMGTAASPITGKASLMLAAGGNGVRYGLDIRNGGKFWAHGSTRTPYGFVVESIPPGGASFKVSASSAIGWAAGDLLAVGASQGTGSGGVEYPHIASITGSDPLTVNLTVPLAAGRVLTSTAPIVVANITRNVLIRSSGTAAASNTAYLLSHATSTDGFEAHHAEFYKLGCLSGGALADQEGVKVRGPAHISSSAFHQGLTGLYVASAPVVLEGNAFVKGLAVGLEFGSLATGASVHANVSMAHTATGILGGSAGGVFSGNIICSNGGVGINALGTGSWYADNTVCLNAAAGMNAQAGDYGGSILRNWVYGNATDGIQVQGGPFVVEGNIAYANAQDGIDLSGPASQVSSNTSSGNGQNGFRLQNAPHLLAGNSAFGNTINGFAVTNSSVYFMGNYSYANSIFGMEVSAGTPTWIGGALGRDPALNPAPNGSAAIGSLVSLGRKSVQLGSSWVNGPISNPNFSLPNDSVISYNHDHSTGTTLIQGDYESGSDMAFDHSQMSYGAFKSSIELLRGTGHTANAGSLSNANAVSQLITIEYRGGQWHVDGSVTGPDMAVFTGNQGLLAVPSGNAQFLLTLTQGTPQEGDRLAFVLGASSQDNGIQKRIYFSDANPFQNNGRSRLRSPTGNLTFRGIPGYPTIIDRLNGSSTYYSIIASATFTAEYSSFSNIDGGGLQLSQNGTPITLASTTFDAMGFTSANNAYLTLNANALGGSATFYGLEFGNSRSTAAVGSASNIRLIGSPPYPTWTLRKWYGAMGGEDYDSEPANEFQWAPFQPAAAVSTFTAVTTGTISTQWSAGANDEGIFFIVQASTAADFTGTVIGTRPYGLSGTNSGLLPNTSYYLRVYAANQWGTGAQDFDFSAVLPLGATATLALAPSTTPAGQFSIWQTSSVWGWVASPAAPSSSSNYGYLLEASSTNFNGTGFIYSSATTSNFVSTLTVIALENNTTYFFRVAALNEFGAPSNTLLGSSPTLAQAVVPGSFGAVLSSSITVTWTPLAPAPQSSTSEGYLVLASSTDFGGQSPGGLVYSSRTPSASLPSLMVTGLSPQTTYYFQVGSLNWAGVPNFVTAGSTVTGGDVTAPRALSDLSIATAALSGALVDLQWTAPGDEDDYNQINGGEYRIQYASYSVVFATGDAQVVFSTSGVLPGQLQVHRLSGLLERSTYFFRAWTRDDAGNWSGISNGTTFYFSWSTGTVGGGSKQVSAVVGPDGKHHVFYNDGGNNLIHASRFSGQPWSTEVAAAGATESGVRNASFIDSSGTIHLLLAYGTPAGSLGYASWNGAWSSVWLIDGDVTAIDSLALAVDAGGVVHAAWARAGALYYSTRSAAGVWSTANLGGAQTGAGVGLTLRPDGAPLILYSNVAEKLRLLDWQGSGFVARVIDDAVDNQQAVGLVYDQDGLTAAAYKDSATNTLRIATAAAPSGTWSNALSVPMGTGHPYLSFALDGSGSGELLYLENTAALSTTGGGDLRRIRIGDAYSNELIGPAGGLGSNDQFPAVFIDTGGVVHAAYARAAAGPIEVSSSVFVTGAPAASVMPGSFAATAVNQTSVTWSWVDRAPNEMGFRVYGGTSAPYALIAGTATLGAGSASYSETGLLANATYFRYAVVVSSGGFGLSLGTQAVTLAQMPGPAASTFTAVTTFSVTAAWSANSNSPGTRYEFEASTETLPNALPANIQLSTAPEGSSGIAFGVLANTTYFMRVRTISRNGTPTDYWVLGSTTTPIETPSEVMVDAVSSTTLLLRATAVASGFTNLSTGAAGVRFVVGGSTLPWAVGSSVTFVTGLVPNTLYTLKARARNLEGTETADSPTVSTYTLAAVPSTATPSFPNTFVSSVSLQWTHNGNPAPTQFRVQASTAADFSGSSDTFTAWLTGTSAQPASLTPNTTLYFKVQARNGAGTKTAYADLGSTVTWAAQPGLSGVVFSLIGQSSVTVNWALGGNPPGTEFMVKTSSVSDFTGDVFIEGWLSALTTTFTGLSPDTTYYWTVGARNHGGLVSQLLSLGAQATLPFPPAASTAPFHSVGVTSATVQWTANGNSASAQYEAEASTDPAFGTSFKSGWVAFLSTTVAGLTGDATYYWRVRSRGVAGIPVDYLALGSPAMGAADPVAPRFLAVGPASVALEWGTGGNRAGAAMGLWSTRASLPAARERHAAALLGGRVYVVGGIVGGAASSEVWSAPVTDSGDVGPWTRQAGLPAPRESHALVAYAGRLYVLGGFDGVAKDSVYWAPVSADGSVGDWRSGKSLPAPRFKLAAVTDGGWLYAIGGDNGVISQSTVYAAPLAADGSIGTWATATALPSARNSHGAAVSEGYVYVAGGLGAGLAGEVWSAPLAGAAVGPWTAQPLLGTPVFRHSLLAVPGRLVSVAGHDGNAAIENIQHSPMLGGGALGAWGTHAAMPLGRFGHAAILTGRDVVVIGGSDGSIATADTFDAKLGGTEYLTEYAQDIAYSVAYASTGWRPGAALELRDLTPNTTYYARMKARTQAGATGVFVDAGSTITLAAVPASALSTFTAVFEGSMTVTWAANGNPAGTEFLAGLSTSSDFTTTALTGWGTSVSSTVFGLSPNTTYFVAALARNKAGTDTPALFLGATMTLAAVPQNSSFTAVGGFSFTALWSTAANPSGTPYEAEISLSSAFSPPAASSTTLNASAQFFGLLGSSTYYMRVRALNGRGAPSGFAATTWTTTGLDISSPSVVGGLEAHPSETAGTLLALWTSPGDDGASGDLQPGSRYYLQWAAGDPNAVAWSTANAQLSVSTGPLTPGSSSSMLVPGLPVGSNVFLRVWTLDDGGMVSDPSGVVTAWVSPFDLSRLDGTGTDAGRGVSLAVDRSGNAHASYTAGTIIQELRYMKRNGGVWSVPEGPDPGIPAADTVVAVDWAGVPQVFYRNAQTGQLRHARRTSSWAVSAVASGNLVPGGLALTATGQARITYYDAAAGDLLYGFWDGAAWQSETVDATGDVGATSSLALDAGGTPSVAYFDGTNGNLKFASRTAPGAWTVSTVDSAAAVVGSAPALALDGIGGAYVAYLDQTSADLKIARFDGSFWSLSTVDAISTAAAVGGIALDGAGNPVVSYYDGTRKDLLFARFDGTNWSTGTVDSRGERGAASALSVDAAGEVQVLHYNADAGDLMAARWAAGLAVPYGGNPRGGLHSPANFAGVVQSSTTIQWTWTDSAASELGWSLYGSLSSTGPYTLVAATTAIPATAGTGTNRSYSESGLTKGTTYYRYVVAVASGGYAASAIASTVPFITADVDTPVIVSFQAADTVWRRAAGALYNVDFTDTGGSLLSSFQVRASTVPNGTGPAWVDFTDVSGSLLTDSYTADWALPAPFFGAMADGVTNYISVRVFDGAGNSSVSTDTFSVLKDTSPPSFADFQDGDFVRRAAGGTLYNIDAVDRASGLERFQYSVSLTPTAGDAAVVGWTDIPLVAGATDYTADWGVSFASLVEDATNYVSVRAWDLAGSTAVLTDAFYVVKDTAGPRVGFTLPASAYRSVLTQLSGTAADVAGVGGVEVAVQTAPVGGLWWDGGAFASGVPVWLAASGTASWTFASVPPWTDGGAFRLVVRASDTLGNYSAPYSTADFTYDASSPTVGVTTPLDASTIAALPAISGTALDPGGAPSGLSLIELRLSRVADGLFWNWTGGGWTASPIATTPVLGSPWTVAVPEALRSNLAHGASYFISVRAVDGATPVNTGSFAVGSTFTWTDTTPPAAVTDLTGLSGPSPGEVRLAWTAPGEDGALGNFVLGQYRIHYSTDPAAVFSTVAAQVAFSTGGVVPGAYQGRLITGLLAGSTYHVRVFTSDDSGNWSTLSNGATVLATPQPFNKITGQVMKVSSEGITAVLVEAYDAAGVLVSSAYSLADGSGTFSLDNILPGVYRVQASWTAGEVTSAVWLDNIAVGSYGVQFVLEVSYTLSSLTGTLASLSAQSASPSGFLTRAAESSFQDSRVQLLRGGRQVAEVKPDPTGRWSISNLLPGKYAVRAYNGLEFSDALPVELGEGETQEVTFVFDPLPEAQAFAFPNPARDQTTVRFVSGLPGLEAQVSIFDIAGVMVKEIPGSAMTAKPGGLYHAVWDLTNDRGESVASGVYLFMVKVRGSNGQIGKVIKKLAIVR